MNHEETKFKFCMEAAADHPAEFLNGIKAKKLPDYWEEFWACYAAIRLHDEDYKTMVFDKYTGDAEEGNDFHLLLAYEKYLEFSEDPDYEPYLEAGYDYLVMADENLSPLLQDAFDALHTLLPVEEDVLPVEDNFYTQQLFIA